MTPSCISSRSCSSEYAFFDIDDRVPGAVVRIEEHPELSAPVQADGSYFIEVPENANVTPYIDSPDGYNNIHLQTFRTSGSNLEHVNFQVVPDLCYYGFAALLGVPLDEDGRLINANPPVGLLGTQGRRGTRSRGHGQ